MCGWYQDRQSMKSYSWRIDTERSVSKSDKSNLDRNIIQTTGRPANGMNINRHFLTNLKTNRSSQIQKSKSEIRCRNVSTSHPFRNIIYLFIYVYLTQMLLSRWLGKTENLYQILKLPRFVLFSHFASRYVFYHFLSLWFIPYDVILKNMISSAMFHNDHSSFIEPIKRVQTNAVCKLVLYKVLMVYSYGEAFST